MLLFSCQQYKGCNTSGVTFIPVTHLDCLVNVSPQPLMILEQQPGAVCIDPLPEIREGITVSVCGDLASCLPQGSSHLTQPRLVLGRVGAVLSASVQKDLPSSH